MRNGVVTIILVASSLLAAAAALAGLETWIPIAAAVTALLTGVQALRTALLIPFRVRAAVEATRQVALSVAPGQEGIRHAVAVQIAKGIWVTVHIAAKVGDHVLLGDYGWSGTVSAIENQIVVIEHRHRWPLRTDEEFAEASWLARPGGPVKGGDRVLVIEHVEYVSVRAQIHFPSLRVLREYVVLGSVDDELALAGPELNRKSIGSPVINARTGRVVALVTDVTKDSERSPGMVIAARLPTRDMKLKFSGTSI
jgi:hypothetical protein